MSEPAIPDFCVHSKFVRGCPSCTYHYLKRLGVVKPSRHFDHYNGLTRWNPEALCRVK